MNESIVEMLARWSCMLNSWEWPQDMPGKPDDFDNLPVFSKEDKTLCTRFTVIEILQNEIRSLVGDYAILHWLHIHKLNHSEEEFIAWWTALRGGSETLERYYEKRRAEKETEEVSDGNRQNK